MVKIPSYFWVVICVALRRALPGVPPVGLVERARSLFR